MPRPLTPEEQAALLRLAEEIEREDPALARRLARHSVIPHGPTEWPAWVWLVLGVLFLAAGIGLGVGSAIAAGVAFLVGAVVKSPGRRRALTAWSKRWLV